MSVHPPVAPDSYPGAPTYFRRVWDPELSPNPAIFVVPGPLVIYGYAARSPYPEDWAMEDRAYERGGLPSVCFSSTCPEGEYGMSERADLVEITAAEFEAARDAGWPA